MRRKIQKIIAIVLLVTMSISMTACRGVTSSTEETEPPKTLKDLPFYEEYYPNDLITKMSNEKNKEYEMEVGVYETYDDMVEEYLKTFVSLETNVNNPKKHWNQSLYGSGNIYDIDNNNMYIITCAHNFRTSLIETQNYINIRFVDDEIVTINSDCLYIDANGNDIALLKIPLSIINQTTLETIKTINISKSFDTIKDEFLESKLYCFKFKDNMYSVNYIDPENCRDSYFTYDNEIEHGTSGGGIIDINGNYYSMMVSGAIVSFGWLSLYNDLLTQVK